MRSPGTPPGIAWLKEIWSHLWSYQVRHNGKDASWQEASWQNGSACQPARTGYNRAKCQRETYMTPVNYKRVPTGQKWLNQDHHGVMEKTSGGKVPIMTSWKKWRHGKNLGGKLPAGKRPARDLYDNCQSLARADRSEPVESRWLWRRWKLYKKAL